MKKFYNRSVVITEGQEVVRLVTEKNGVASIRYQNQQLEVKQVSGTTSNKTDKWAVK
jgi:hypothetical protein